MIKQRWPLVLVLFAWACAGPVLAQASPDVSGSAYTPSVRPDAVAGPTTVALGVFVLDLVSIDDVGQEFTADLVVSGRWVYLGVLILVCVLALI